MLRLSRQGLTPRRFAPWAAALCLGALLALCAGCSGDQKDQRQRPPAPVTLGEATIRDVPQVIKAIGRVEAPATVSIKTRVTGQLLTVHFKEGQYVKKGDPLFTIDPAPFEAALKIAQATAARDQAQADKAAQDLKRYEQLITRHAVSAAQYEQYQTEAKARAAVAQASQAEVANAKLNLGYCHIASPISGVMGGLLAYAGNMIKANDDKAMVTITQVEPILVSLAVPEQDLARIRRQQAQGVIWVEASLAGEPGPPARGQLVFVDNTVDTATGTIRLKASFDNPDHRLWPGQFVSAAVVLAVRKGVTVVPTKAITAGQAGPYVFALEPGGDTVRVQPVKPGETMDDLTVVDQGLKPGDKVVTDGQVRLVPGAKVVIKGGEGPAGGKEAK